MQLLTINGTSVEHATKDQVVQQIKAAGRVWIPAHPAALSFLAVWLCRRIADTPKL